MATAVDLRKDLLKHRVSRQEFAKRCGMKVSVFDRMLARGEELPAPVLFKWREMVVAAEESAAEEASSSIASNRLLAELGRRGVNPYVREIWLPGRVQGSLQVSPDFEGPLGLEVRVKVVEGEPPWVYELDGRYNRKGQLLEDVA